VTSRALPPADPDYPAALLPLAAEGADPPTLWVRGALPAATGVAIVGTRKPSEDGARFAHQLAGDLARQGIAVWSGGAVGIDAAAHEGALAAGGVTVVAAGGGLARPYPAEHRGLYDRVLAAGGALVARVPDEVAPMPRLFLARNEILAAMTAATVVIEAGYESGARNTAAAARRLGRALCVVPHPPWSERGRGCLLELLRGAVPIAGVAEVLLALGRPPPPPAPRKPRRPAPPPAQRALPLPVAPEEPEDPAEAAVLAALDEVPRHRDEVQERAGLPGAIALGALLTLTLRAVVVEGPAGFFRRATPVR
jgi:DNA processing protein